MIAVLDAEIDLDNGWRHWRCCAESNATTTVISVPIFIRSPLVSAGWLRAKGEAARYGLSAGDCDAESEGIPGHRRDGREVRGGFLRESSVARLDDRE